MDTIVWILILLTAFNFLLKQTFWKPVAVGAAAGIAAIFVILMWPYAIEQSKTQIADWLSDNQLMLDTSVVLTLEIVLQMAFCLLAVHVANYSPVKKRMMLAYRLLYWFPGVLIIPVLFFGLTQAVFSFPGVSFKLIAWFFGGICFRDYPFGKMVNQMAVAGRGFAFGVVFPDECFGCYFRNYCHGKWENGGRGCE